MTERRAFRAESLDQALELVNEELGPEAIVVRQREGVIGGVGGFFGRHCVELEVEVPADDEPTLVGWPTPLPARQIVDLYDTGDSAPADEDPGPLVEALLAQASPFADALAEKLGDTVDAVLGPAEAEVQVPGTDVPGTPEPEAEAEVLVPGTEVPGTPDQEPEAEVLVPGTEVPGTGPAVAPIFAPALVEAMLVRRGLSERTAREVVAEAQQELRIFDPLVPFEHQVRAALARRIRIARAARKRRRVVALVGPPGCGKTLTAARLCHAHGAAGGRDVAALSLAPVRDALALADQTKQLEFPIAVASEEHSLAGELESLAPVDVLVVDTPGVEPDDEKRLRTLGQLLELVGPDETHLLVPASYGVDRVRALVETFASTVGADRLLITHLDGGGSGAGPVAAALSARVPISFTSVGTSWGLRPADAGELAALLVT
ncbi:MAG TPA: hypothetical protein VFB25_09050 [Gaiellaceae bacterium]|nr:hypothetical protein [Gaiellaceae bacterium]